LLADFNGKGRVPLVAMSQTMFSPRLLGTYEFVTDDHGVVRTSLPVREESRRVAGMKSFRVVLH